jgi:hypothetical protein
METAVGHEVSASYWKIFIFLLCSQGMATGYALTTAPTNKESIVRSYFITAERLSLSDKPRQALNEYQKAWQFSRDPSDKKRALFGIARMQFWLGQYVRAGHSYQRLLELSLTPIEYELALAGRVKSLAYYDRPRAAFGMIPSHLVFTTPQLIIAASQASLWSDWPDITKTTLTSLQDLSPNTALGKDLQELQWQTKLATSPHVVTPSVFVSHDSEDFNKQRTIIDYSHYWNYNSQTFVGLDAIHYDQGTSHQLNARGIYVAQTLRPTRHFIFYAQGEPIEYKNKTLLEGKTWAPLLWNTHVNYTPNDYVSLRILALREIIETFPAFENQITDQQYASSLSINPLPYLQVNAAYSRLNISDSNHRDSYSLSSTMLLLPTVGLSATGLLREYTDQFTSPNYFSPYNYKAASFLLKLGRKLGATWHYYLDGGVGRQYITSRPSDPTVQSPTYQWGLGITGPMTSWLVWNAYYADIKQASAFLDSPDYHYQYGGISINILI